MTAVLGKSEKEILALWKEQSRSGNVGPLMFAIVSYKDVNMDLLMDVYGEVHMQAHANMTQIHDIRKKLVCANEKILREKQVSSLKNEVIRKMARVKRSDLVICPVNCNSHNACLKVKKLCNQYDKELKILSSSSLSAVSHALFNSEDKVILN